MNSNNELECTLLNDSWRWAPALRDTTRTSRYTERAANFSQSLTPATLPPWMGEQSQSESLHKEQLIIETEQQLFQFFFFHIMYLENRNKNIFTSCSAYGWTNRHWREYGISFHHYPKEPERRIRRVIAVKRQSWPPTTTSRICNEHSLNG